MVYKWRSRRVPSFHPKGFKIYPRKGKRTCSKLIYFKARSKAGQLKALRSEFREQVTCATSCIPAVLRCDHNTILYALWIIFHCFSFSCIQIMEYNIENGWDGTIYYFWCVQMRNPGFHGKQIFKNLYF